MENNKIIHVLLLSIEIHAIGPPTLGNTPDMFLLDYKWIISPYF